MKERCCARCFILLLPLLLFLISGACASGISCEIIPADSTWIPGESALFEGSVTTDGAFSAGDISMVLSLRTDPDLSEPGTIVFSEINGKKLSIRNQKDKYSTSLQGSSEIHFSGSWLLPENLYLSEISLALTVLAPDGSILGEASAPITGNASVSVSSGMTFPDLAAPIRYVLIAAAAIWILAAVRIFIYQKRRKAK